jgi:hypothetical protein
VDGMKKGSKNEDGILEQNMLDSPRCISVPAIAKNSPENVSRTGFDSRRSHLKFLQRLIREAVLPEHRNDFQSLDTSFGSPNEIVALILTISRFSSIAASISDSI